METLILLFIWGLTLFFDTESQETNQEKKKVKPKVKARIKNQVNSKTSENESWSYLREIILDKYNYQCSICGQYGEIDVHHKIPIKEGGTNEIENLITLCRNCHENLHHFKFSNDSISFSDEYGQQIKKSNECKKGYILLQAISNKYKLKIRYKTQKSNSSVEINERIIEPIQLKYGYEIHDNEYISNSLFAKNKLFIYAFCELRQEMRIFRFDRLEILSVIKQ